jgi:NADPH:quinone reductase-like Zn-dependent oxidoreductase/SAM-dependent methyltransferase/acyl carrier protein
LGCRPVAAPGDIGALLYAPVWRPAGVSILPEPSLLAKQIRHHVDLSDYLQYLPKSDALCSAYVAQAFQQLGAHFDFGREVVLSAAIQPAYQELLPRLWGMLEADRLIDSQHRSLQTRLPPPSSLLAEIQSSHPAQAPETALLARCGGALADVLSGALDPLTLLFGAAEQDGARRVYAEGRYALALNTLAANALDQALPSAGGLRVLEIGAGTGGTTRRILPVLKGRVREYWFTDISPGFLSAASQVFGADDFFRTALLDIERPAEDQGMKAGYFDLVIAANVMHATRDLAAAVAHAVGALAPGGWLLVIEGLNDSRWLDLTFGLTAGWRLREDRELRPRSPLLPAVVWNQLLRRHGCDDVAVLTPGSGRLSDQGVILASKGSPRPAQQTVCRAALRATDPVAAVLAELQADPDSVTQRLIATRGGQSLRPWEVPDSLQSSVWGLVRAAALECPGQRMRLVDLDPLEQNPQRTLRLEASIDDNEREVAWRDGRRYVLRLTSIEAQTPLPERFRIAPSATGLLDSLAPRPLAKSAPGAGEVEIAVAAAGLNFKDLLTVLGALSADSVTSGLGGECAGTVSAVGPDVTEFHLGERVMAWVSGSFASHVIVPLTRVIRIPPAMTLAQGAAFPVAATTVFHALDEVGHLATGQRVLIHAATGGIGTFALAWARSVGAEVLATAGAAWKREWLRRQGVQHVFDSRTPAFASQVMTATAGEGVDVALNSLTGEMVAATLGLVRAGGVFVELGRTEIWPEEQVAARFPQVSYRVVALDAVSEAEGSRLIRGAVDAFLSGKLPAPNVTAVPMARLVEALRSMQQAQHLGKIVLTIPRPYRINPDRGYLITGGLGGLGLVTAEWLVARGARHLALVSRSAPNAAAQSRIRALEAAGAKVSCLVADLSKAAEISRVGEAIRSVLPTLAGILHAAGLLDDAVLAEQTPQHFVRVAGPKLTPLADLAEMAAAADAFLVLFSSAAGLLGSAGQANHAAISSQLDALALSYRVRGIAATSIDWGAWSDIGAAAKRGVGERLSVIGMGMISPQQGIEALEAILFEQTRPIGAQIAVLPIDRAALSRHFGQSLPPLFGEILRREKDDRDLQPKKEAKETAADPFELNLAALPAGRRLEHTAKWIEAQARGLLNAGAGGMRHDRPLTEMGLDSLLAVELRNRLGALTGISLPATLLFNYPTILALAEYLLTLLLPEQTAHAEPPTRPSASDPSLEDEILSLDESDLDAILRDMEQRHLT